jgi:hypothetical protein
MTPPPDEIRGRAAEIEAENLRPPRAVPCVECGTEGGYAPPGQKRPRRRDGAAWGTPGPHCDTCYRRHFGGRKFVPVAQREMAGGAKDPTPEEIRKRAEAIRRKKGEART